MERPSSDLNILKVGMMNSVLISLLLLYLAITFLVWQMTKIKKELIATELEVSDAKSRVKAQEDHLKATLGIMQDLAKKLHVQQEVIDITTARLTQIEIQNAELVALLTRSIQNTATKNTTAQDANPQKD